MSWKIILHLLWFTASASDAIADILIAVFFFRMKKRFGRYLGMMMVSISIEAIIAACSLLVFWLAEIEVAPAFTITRTLARTIKATGAWTLYAYLFFWLNGDLGEGTVPEVV